MGSSIYHEASQVPWRLRMDRGTDTPSSFGTKLSAPSKRHFAQVTKVLQPHSARTRDPGGESQTIPQKGHRSRSFIRDYPFGAGTDLLAQPQPNVQPRSASHHGCGEPGASPAKSRKPACLRDAGGCSSDERKTWCFMQPTESQEKRNILIMHNTQASARR